MYIKTSIYSLTFLNSWQQSDGTGSQDDDNTESPLLSSESPSSRLYESEVCVTGGSACLGVGLRLYTISPIIINVRDPR